MIELAGMLSFEKIKILIYLLLVTIAAYLANSVLIFVMDLKLVESAPLSLDEVRMPKSKISRSHPYQYYKRIWERNLFAVRLDASPKDRAEDLISRVDKLSLTSLNCTLMGTIIHENGHSWAIIKDNRNKRQEKYTVGSSIGGARVVMILRNKVVLNMNGKDELLMMGIEEMKNQKGGGGGSWKDRERKGEAFTFKISKDFVRESMNNVAQIISTVRIKPHFTKGQPDGFRISHPQKGSLFKTMGFKSGDIIKSVNDRNIYSAEDIMHLYEALKDSDFFSIGIVRDNKPMTLNFKVR